MARSPLLKCLCCPTLAERTGLDTVVYCRVSEISLQFSCSSALYGQLCHGACRSCRAGCKPFLTDPARIWLEMNTKTICKMSFVKVLSRDARTHRQGRLLGTCTFLPLLPSLLQLQLARPPPPPVLPAFHKQHQAED